jgi:uracil-DNA glycosylase family 4
VSEGFFSSTAAPVQPRRTPLLLIPKCGACGLYQTCESPKMPVSGKGDRGVLIVGEAPGEDEDDQGRQFVGKTGQRLRRALRALDINADRDCWFTNALICRPPGNKIPKDQMVEWCRPNLITTINELKPKVVILLGGRAIDSLIGHLWREGTGEVRRWVGWNIPSQQYNTWVCPTYHPSYIERAEDDQTFAVLERMWLKHLRGAFAHSSRPFKTAPNFAERISVELDAGRAAKMLLGRFNQRQKPIAFDFETTCLKPDGPKAEIWCCAVSDGDVTIAYPWQGEAVKATWELLHNKEVPKIGYNMKFEERWVLAKSGKPVANWRICGMTATHVLDNRPMITALKFQAFVLLGQQPYDDHIRPYLDSEGGNTANRIKEAPLAQVLQYCGMDALLEWNVAQEQKKPLGVKL